jgi:hypothetical protein
MAAIWQKAFKKNHASDCIFGMLIHTLAELCKSAKFSGVVGLFSEPKKS